VSTRVSAVVGCLLLVAFGVFTAVTWGDEDTAFNRECARFAEYVAGAALQPLFAPADAVGSPVVSGVLAIVLALWLAVRRGVAAGVAALVLFCGISAIEGLMRVRLDRVPWQHLVAFAQHPHGWHLVHSTYPSGHTARLALLAGVAAASMSGRAWGVWLAAVLVAAWVALQRVESGAHTGADVVGAALLAFGLACLYGAALPWLERLRGGAGERDAVPAREQP
jgi:membrane-associated phospholipid phosphatase